jgi:epoxyqueuosine reductase
VKKYWSSTMKDFSTLLNKIAQECGAHSACCLDLNHPDLKKSLKENRLKSENWIKSGYAGDMNYLERMLEDKAEPQKFFPGAQSAIVITYKNNWGTPEAQHPFPPVKDGELLGYLSAYAKEQDYHKTGHQILTRIHQRLEEEYGPFEATPAVDTKPVFERLLATLGGLGIRGPNDLLRTPQENVRVFIGSLICNIPLPEVILDPKMPYPCKHCQNCVEKCPTGALTAGEPFNSLECISYLTIEKKGILNKAERLMMEDWLFGCDWCTVVCPPKDKIDTRIPVSIDWLFKSSAGEIKRLIKGSAIEYAGVTKLRRNAAAILQESQHPQAKGLLQWAKENLKSPLVQEQLSTTQ